LPDSPNPKKSLAARIKVLSEINKLKVCERPREKLMLAWTEIDRNDPSLVPVWLKRIHQFPFDPHGPHGIRRENDQKPITTLQCATDLVMPVRTSGNMLLANPIVDAVYLKDL
jgi:hypothetical protein